MSESSKIPPTPKLGSISLPDDNDNTKIFGGRIKRLLFSNSSKNHNSLSRSTTPAPVPVTPHQYPHSGGHPRQRASSMSRPLFVPESAPSTSQAAAPRHSIEQVRGGPSKLLQHPTTVYMSQSATRVQARGSIGKHAGPDTPKYMKAMVKEVALKEESIVLNWPLVPFSERRHLRQPLVYYDCAFDPREPGNIRDNRQNYFLALPQEDRELPVSTHCKLTEMVIHCPHVGSLVVERPEGLRCIDLFYAIYCKYQKRPRSHEKPAVTDKAKYQLAFEQRCIDCPGLAEYNRTQVGFLRVDLLRGKRIFDGLKRSHGRWELQFDSPPPKRQ